MTYQLSIVFSLLVIFSVHNIYDERSHLTYRLSHAGKVLIFIDTSLANPRRLNYYGKIKCLFYEGALISHNDIATK